MPYGVRQFIKAVAALLSALGVAACIYLMHAASFSGGESTYYLYSASSQARIKDVLSLADLAHLKGESVVYVLENGEAGENGGPSANAAAGLGGTDGFTASSELAEAIMAEYRASLCFVEETDGTISYYCYSSRLKGGIVLGGQKVNLHLAVRKDSLAVGSPIIFGGY